MAIVCGAYQPRLDGVSAYVERLIHDLGSRIDPLIITAHPTDAAPGVPVLAEREDWRIDDLLHVASVLRRERVDMVHIQYAPVAFRWRRALRLLPVLVAGMPIVVTVHEFEREMLPLLRRADAVITTTTEHTALIKAADPAIGGRVELVPIGPNIQPSEGDPSVLGTAARARWAVPCDAPLVVFFGFLHPVKGLEYLLRAIVQVRERCSNVRLVLAGGWRSLALADAEGDAYCDRLKALIDELHLQNAVRMTGFLEEPEVSRLLFAADVVALPFTFGLSYKSGTLLAALSHGRAVVGTRAPIDDPLLCSGEHLLSVPPRNAAALAQAILALLEDPAERERIALQGAVAAAPFNWNAIAAQHLDVYARVSRRTNAPLRPPASRLQSKGPRPVSPLME